MLQRKIERLSDRYEAHKIVDMPLDVFVSMAKEMHEESDFADEELSIEYLARLIHHPEVFAMAVFDVRSKKYVGMLVGMISRAFFGPTIRANDFGFFVQKEHRGSMAALFLLQKFEKWAISNGAKKIYMGSTTKVDVDKYKRFLIKSGYKEVGFMAKKEV